MTLRVIIGLHNGSSLSNWSWCSYFIGIKWLSFSVHFVFSPLFSPFLFPLMLLLVEPLFFWRFLSSKDISNIKGKKTDIHIFLNMMYYLAQCLWHSCNLLFSLWTCSSCFLWPTYSGIKASKIIVLSLKWSYHSSWLHSSFTKVAQVSFSYCYDSWTLTF